MSIKSQIEDADMLSNNGRYIGALTNVLLAISASSRKLYPKPKTKSRKYTTKEMGDGEAFKLYLGEELSRILLGNCIECSSGIRLPVGDKTLLIEDILYHNVRCALIHNAELPYEVKFETNSNSNSNFTINGLKTAFCNGKLVLDTTWLKILMDAVINSKVNYDIFHRELKILQTNKSKNAEEDFIKNIIHKYDISPGRYEILKRIISIMNARDVIFSNEKSIEDTFNFIILNLESYGLNDNMMTGLTSRNIINYNRQLQDKGCNIIKEMAEFYKVS